MMLDRALATTVPSLTRTIHSLRWRYGRKVIYYGSVQESRDEAPMRIAFSHIPDAELEGD